MPFILIASRIYHHLCTFTGFYCTSVRTNKIIYHFESSESDYLWVQRSESYSCIIIVVWFCLFLWFYCQPTILFLLPELKINGPIYENRLLLHNAFAKMVISESFSSSLQVRFILDLMTCLWTCKNLVILKFLAFNISVHSVKVDLEIGTQQNIAYDGLL